MNPQMSSTVFDAIALFELEAAEHFFREEHGKYLRNEQSWEEFQKKVQNYAEIEDIIILEK